MDERMNSMERLYQDWLECGCNPATKTEATLRQISGQLDDTEGDSLLLARYEEAARHSGFEAGFRAALSLFAEI